MHILRQCGPFACLRPASVKQHIVLPLLAAPDLLLLAAAAVGQHTAVGRLGAFFAAVLLSVQAYMYAHVRVRVRVCACTFTLDAREPFAAGCRAEWHMPRRPLVTCQQVATLWGGTRPPYRAVSTAEKPCGSCLLLPKTNKGTKARAARAIVVCTQAPSALWWQGCVSRLLAAACMRYTRMQCAACRTAPRHIVSRQNNTLSSATSTKHGARAPSTNHPPPHLRQQPTPTTHCNMKKPGKDGRPVAAAPQHLAGTGCDQNPELAAAALPSKEVAAGMMGDQGVNPPASHQELAAALARATRKA